MKSNSNERIDITRSVCKDLLAEIKHGDIDHGLSIAEMILSEGPSYDPELLIDIVEAVLELSKQAGAENAKSYLDEKWPILRNAHLRRFKSRG